MGYYGVSVYRGDYYGQRGDYYHNTRGDPGFFDFLSDVGSAIVNYIAKHRGKNITRFVAPMVKAVKRA